MADRRHVDPEYLNRLVVSWSVAVSVSVSVVVAVAVVSSATVLVLYIKIITGPMKIEKHEFFSNKKKRLKKRKPEAACLFCACCACVILCAFSGKRSGYRKRSIEL